MHNYIVYMYLYENKAQDQLQAQQQLSASITNPSDASGIPISPIMMDWQWIGSSCNGRAEKFKRGV